MWFTWWYWFYIVRGWIVSLSIWVQCFVSGFLLSCWFNFGGCFFFGCWAETWELLYRPARPQQQSWGGVERAVEKCRDRDSLLLAHPPLCSCTLSTQIILAADGGSTAPLQWDGGGGKRSSLFTNRRFSPGAAAVRWDLSGGAWWSVTQQSAGFYHSQTTAGDFYCTLLKVFLGVFLCFEYILNVL